MPKLCVLKYRFWHWFFRWVKDSDGDIGFQIAGVVTFIKYKEHTLTYFFREYEDADKYQGHDPKIVA